MVIMVLQRYCITSQRDLRKMFAIASPSKRSQKWREKDAGYPKK